MCQKQKIFSPLNLGKKAFNRSPLSFTIKLVGSVDHYKYLGIVMDFKLKFSKNCDIIFKKGQQRLHFLRKLRSFNVDKTTLTLFCRCFVESVFTFSISCWWAILRLSDKSKLQLINICKQNHRPAATFFFIKHL